MELNEMHVGQTVFRNGERNKPCKVTAIGCELFIGKAEGIGESAYHAEYYQPIPRDLHDKNGKPLKMGDAFKCAVTERTVCGAWFMDGGRLVIKDESAGTSWYEESVTKVEHVETVDDVIDKLVREVAAHEGETLKDLLTRKERGCMAVNTCGYWGDCCYLYCIGCPHESSKNNGLRCREQIAQDIARQAYALGLRDGAK